MLVIFAVTLCLEDCDWPAAVNGQDKQRKYNDCLVKKSFHRFALWEDGLR
jgi:hypothetical protein